MSFCADEWSFGQTGSACRSFDFNLAAQAYLLILLPACIFLILAFVRCYTLSKKEARVNRERYSVWLCSAKEGLAITNTIASLLCLIAWTTIDRNASYLVALTLDLVVALQLPVLVYLEHFYTFRSSVTVPLYLAFTTLVGIVRLRSYVLLDLHSTSKIFFAPFCIAFAAKTLLLAAEHFSKRKMLLNRKGNKASPELTASFTSRITLFWFVKYLRMGLRGQIKASDLGSIDNEEPQAQYERFDRAWISSQQHRFRLLRTLFQTLEMQAITPLVPAALVVLITFCVPLILNATLSFLDSHRSESEPQPAAYGYALAVGTTARSGLSNAESISFLKIAYGLAVAGISTCTALFEVCLSRLIGRLRLALMQAVYRKALNIHISVADDLGSGALSSFESIDIERVADAVKFMVGLLV